MNLATLVVAFYGLFSLAGGIIGYVKVQSKASLIAGSISGLILIVSAFGIAKGIRTASLMSLAVALLLGGRFLGTWFKTRRLMPDLLMIFLSALTLVVVGLKLM